MKKVFIKLLCAIIATLMMVTAIAGCGATENGSTEEITVRLFDGGYGMDWLKNISEAYSKKNAGVKITIKKVINSVAEEQLVEANKNTGDLVMLNYNFWKNSYDGKGIEDITDVYNSRPDGESKTIAEKCDASLVRHFNMGTSETPKYYQMSWARANTGICYNATTLDTVLGEGNWAVPRTTDELLTLCEQVQGNASKAYAFIFNGIGDDVYIDTYLLPVWTAQYMGYEDYYQYCHGSYSENGGYVFAGDAQKGQTLIDGNGSLPALQVFDDICGKYSHPDSPDLRFNEAQQVFCGYGSGAKKQLVAFMANGDWLENEVSGLLKNKPQDLKMMKTPVISAIKDKCATVNDDATLSAVIDAVDNGENSYSGVSAEDFARIKEARTTCTSLSYISCLCIPSTSKHIQQTKDFLVYMFSDEAQKIYAKTLNGATMPYGFDSDSDSDIKISEFQKTVNQAFGDITRTVNKVDYSSKLMFYGGFMITTSAAKAIFNKTANGESIYKQYKTDTKNRWEQTLRQAGL